jgi:ribosome-binding protein aMBF1 (putative translation factor)
VGVRGDAELVGQLTVCPDCKGKGQVPDGTDQKEPEAEPAQTADSEKKSELDTENTQENVPEDVGDTAPEVDQSTLE